MFASVKIGSFRRQSEEHGNPKHARVHSTSFVCFSNARLNVALLLDLPDLHKKPILSSLKSALLFGLAGRGRGSTDVLNG